MRIEEPETSFLLLLFPLPQVRAWTGFPRNTCTDITRDTGTGFRYFTSFSLSLQNLFPVKGFAWEPEILPSSKKQDR